MSKPCGLLLAASAISPDLVDHVLNEQGGPEWDETVFRALTGVDVRSLVLGEPVAGAGTAVSIASSGWWLRHLDDLAARLAAVSGQPVLAVFEFDGAQASGYSLATPGAETRRSVKAGALRAWGEGVSALVGGEALDEAALVALGEAAQVVHGDAAEGKDLPGVFVFGDAPDDAAIMLDVRGSALVAGLAWRPVRFRDPAEEPPPRIRAILISTPIRLPGPPRWAQATRAVAVEAARSAVDDDGWVCLIPREGGLPASYGAAVRVLQLAPMPDGSWLGVLHPRCGVKIDEVHLGVADVEPVSEMPADPDALADAVNVLIGELESRKLRIAWSASELRNSPDPAASIGWQIRVNAELCQRYLAAGEPVERVNTLTAALE